MKFQNVCIESIRYVLPDDIVTSAQIESRLEPLYRRLELPPGVLEGMSGIRRRRFWPPGTRPSEISIQSASMAMNAAGIDSGKIGALVHGSICRNFVEPATACLVHRGLNLPASCAVYDVSNACLGMLNGIIQIANMIELGQIQAGIVCGTESTRDVVDNTVELLNADLSLTRARINNVFASLTFGSASAAVLLTHRRLSSTGTRLVGATMESYSAGALLSHTDLDFSITGKVPRLLEIESARLLEEGIAATAENFDAFLRECGWSRSRMERTICHQVGARARRLLIDALGIDASRDICTFEEYGNTGAVAIPLTLALAAERDELRPGSPIGLVGTGAGINSIVMGVEWQGLAVAATRSHNAATGRPASLTAPGSRFVAEPSSGLRSFDS